MPRHDDDYPDGDDPFFSDSIYGDAPSIAAWEIDEQSAWLIEQGYEAGDTITLTWESHATGEVYQTEIELPAGDWDAPETWTDFYQEMRDFYEPLWEIETDEEGGYVGEATAG